MAEFAVVAAGAIMVPALIALLLDWLWPSAPAGRLAMAASLFLPTALGFCLIWFYVDYGRPPPNPEIMNDSLMPGILPIIGPIMVVILWAFGLPAAFETLSVRRRKHER
jgi:hypothetical protein